MKIRDFPAGSEVKASACNAGDLGSIPGLGRSSGDGNGNPLQYSCLENPMDGGAWWAIVHGVAKSWTWLSDFTHSLTHENLIKSNQFVNVHLSISLSILIDTDFQCCFKIKSFCFLKLLQSLKMLSDIVIF